MHLYLALHFFKYNFTKIGLSIRPVDDCHKEVKHIVCVFFPLYDIIFPLVRVLFFILLTRIIQTQKKQNNLMLAFMKKTSLDTRVRLYVRHVDASISHYITPSSLVKGIL